MRRQRTAEEDRLQRDLAAVGVKLEADPDSAELRARGEAIQKQIESLQARGARIAHWGRKVGVVIDPTGNDGWFGGYVGYTASTPVTDGEHIWVKHGTGVAACYDLEGTRKWMVRTHLEDKATTSMPSPMLAGDMLIVVGDAGWWQRNSKGQRLPATAHGGGLGAWMLALDKKTGETRWDAGPIRHVKYGVCNTPYPVPLSNGKETVWVVVTSTGQLLRAQDGKQLLDHMGVSGCFHASPVFAGNRVYLSRGGHTDAVEMVMLDRDTVGVRHLWTSSGGGMAGCVVVGNRIHCTGGTSDRGALGALAYLVKDADTGANLARLDPCLPGSSGDAYVPPVVAGKYVFAFAGNAGAVIEDGPFIVREGRDPLADLGGCAKSLPAGGTKVTVDGRTETFAAVPAEEVSASGVAVRAGDEGPMPTEQYCFALLDNRAGSRCLRVLLSGEADQAWIGGQPVKSLDVIAVRGTGVVPLLLRARFPGDLPPFRRMGKASVVLEEVTDPGGPFRAQIAFIRQHEEALRRVIAWVPRSREAVRAEYLLSFLDEGR